MDKSLLSDVGSECWVRPANPGVTRVGGEDVASGGMYVSSEALLSGRNTLVIEHLGMHYVLRATRNGKLILTK